MPTSHSVKLSFPNGHLLLNGEIKENGSQFRFFSYIMFILYFELLTEYQQKKFEILYYSTRNRLGLVISAFADWVWRFCKSGLRSRNNCTLSNQRLNRGFKSPLHEWAESRKKRVII